MNDATAYPLNCGTIVGGNAPVYTFKKPGIGGDFFKLEVNPIIRTIIPSSTGIITQNDKILVQTSGSTTITDYQTNVQQLIPGTYDISIYSNNSGVILGPNNGSTASGVSSGSASLIAISSNDSFSSANVVVSSTSGILSTVLSDYVIGSLAKEVNNAVDSRIVGLNASTAKPIFSTQNHASPSYVRNSGCWVNDVNLTSISPWNSTEGINRAGVLISRRHIIFAAHYQINNGSTIRFVDNNNNIVTRTMVNKLTHPSYVPYYPDLTVGLLDSDVPNTINFVKILPQNWSNYLPSLSNIYRLPCLVLDQEEKALISELYDLDTYANFLSPTNLNRLAFFENVIIGDSGNPAFLIINGELVIITVWTYGGAGRGTSIVYHKDAINTMMSSLAGTNYSLTEIDLSGFTDYS